MQNPDKTNKIDNTKGAVQLYGVDFKKADNKLDKINKYDDT
ncbi:hypothetical protein ABXT08_17135 [Chryseobacterium sp. NRRL B-14859]|nr:hypothetical protein [Chryseobacterium sp. G0240]